MSTKFKQTIDGGRLSYREEMFQAMRLTDCLMYDLADWLKISWSRYPLSCLSASSIKQHLRSSRSEYKLHMGSNAVHAVEVGPQAYGYQSWEFSEF